MATVTHGGPVNPAQVIAELGATGCTVRANDDDGTWEVEVPGVSAADITAALGEIAYDAMVDSA